MAPGTSKHEEFDMSSTQPATHMRLDGKIAVITGGAQGVGFGIAQEFIDYGATVVVVDNNKETLDAAAAALGEKATAIHADVTDLTQMQALYDGVKAPTDASTRSSRTSAQATATTWTPSRSSSSTSCSESTSRACCSRCSLPSP